MDYVNVGVQKRRALFSVIGVMFGLFWLGILRQASAPLKAIGYSWPNFNLAVNVH